MLTCFRYQLKITYQALLTILGFTLIIILGNHLSSSGILQAYYAGWPTGLLIVSLLMALTYTSSSFQIALSFGANRLDYFWALQLSALVFTLTAIGSVALLQAVPIQLEDGYEFMASSFMKLPLPTFGILFYTLFSIGSLLGGLMMKRRKLSLFILMIVSASSSAFLWLYTKAQEVTWVSPVFWGLCLTAILLTNWFLYRQISRGEVIA